MIRRIINRLRHVEPARAPLPINQIGTPQMARVASISGGGSRRGLTVTPLDIVVAHRRAASKRARVARRANRHG